MSEGHLTIDWDLGHFCNVLKKPDTLSFKESSDRKDLHVNCNEIHKGVGFLDGLPCIEYKV